MTKPNEQHHISDSHTPLLAGVRNEMLSLEELTSEAEKQMDRVLNQVLGTELVDPSQVGRIKNSIIEKMKEAGLL